MSVDAPAEAELVRLRDGSSVTVRRASTLDEPALRSFLEGLCLEARRLRFFSGAANIALRCAPGGRRGRGALWADRT